MIEFVTNRSSATNIILLYSRTKRTVIRMKPNKRFILSENKDWEIVYCFKRGYLACRTTVLFFRSQEKKNKANLNNYCTVQERSKKKIRFFLIPIMGAENKLEILLFCDTWIDSHQYALWGFKTTQHAYQMPFEFSVFSAHYSHEKYALHLMDTS